VSALSATINGYQGAITKNPPLAWRSRGRRAVQASRGRPAITAALR
jgi:hypothetical protein